MPKTYGTVTTFTAGSVLTAAQLNVASTAINNLALPATLRVSRLTAQSINNVTETQVTWTSKDLDTDGMFTSPSTDVTVQTAGIYVINAGVLFATNATGSRYLHITRNGTTSTNTIASASAMGLTVAGAPTTLNCSCAISLAASDVIRVLVYQASGGALNIGGVPTSIDAGATFLSMAWVGRAT